METLKKRLEEQQERHQGGSKWIGTGGTSPFGNYGYNPEGVRIGGEGGQRPRDQGLGQARVPQPRQQRRARHPQHQGRAPPPAPLRPRGRRRGARPRRDDRRHRAQGLARHPHAPRAAQCGEAAALPRRRRLDGPAYQALRGIVLSAATSEFKNLEFFYFHNCPYEAVWKDNRRRFNERTPTWDVLHKYGHDYKLVFVGDASMSPYEITHPGGSVEHYQRGGRRGLAAADDDHLSGRGLAQPGARAILELYRLDPDRPRS